MTARTTPKPLRLHERQNRVMPAQITALGDDEVEVTISTGQVARDGHIFEPQGALLDNYRRNPIVLWQHNPEHPVANAEDVHINGGGIVARIRFAPSGISHKADEVRGLVKGGIVKGVSVGMDPIDAEPLDPKRPYGGMRVTRWELLECSFVSVPADTDALVTARAHAEERGDDDWTVGASRTLPVEDSDEWDGPAAEASIFTWAGGDDFDPSKARKGFLVYNAAKPKLRGSYKLPIAHVVDGRMRCPKGAIRAAASRLPQADIPDSVRGSAQAVIDHYKELAGMSKSNGDGGKAGDEGRTVENGKTRAEPPALAAAQAKLANEAQGHVARAVTHHSALGDQHDAMSDHVEGCRSAHDKTTSATAAITSALNDAQAHPDDATEHVARAAKAAQQLAGANADMADGQAGMAATHREMNVTHHELGRALKATQRCVRGMVDGAAPGGEDSDSKNVQQVSGDTKDDEGSRKAAEENFKRRQAELRALEEATPS